MTIDSLNPILYALIGIIVIIFIIIAIIVWLVARRARSTKPAQPRKGAVPARSRAQEILRLMRDPDTGRVVTEFQNRTIRDPRTLSKAERDYLIRLAKDWGAWLGVPEAQPAAKVAPAPETATPAVSVPANPPAQAEPVLAAPIFAPAPVAVVQANAPGLPLAQATPVVAPLPAPTTPLSIVQQVDEILQEKLAAQPAPVPVIRLVEDPHDGVVVWVNQTKYVGIESVNDPNVRAIIRSAAVEWEHRTEK
jgi:hypothetical protein